MEENTYKNLRPVEIIEALCQGSANGFAQSVLKTQEERLGLQLPAVLCDFLLRAGRERVCGKEKEIFSPELFQVKDGYLVLREMADGIKTGVLVEDLNKDNPPVYVQDVWGNWDLFADHMEDCLLAELDRRIRKTKTANHSLGYLGSYWKIVSLPNWTEELEKQRQRTIHWDILALIIIVRIFCAKNGLSAWMLRKFRIRFATRRKQSPLMWKMRKMGKIMRRTGRTKI